ncbi:MAG: flagellar hook-associated protein FlgL [Desulfovibrio sp.]|jgi:flagellar hook-associated protein 3 FlgL|nr:flagellar hook-associated protein FlgL [Desulfovibrio sp.]
MAIRITQSMMYGSFVRDMNRTLSDYMDSNIQASSQKKINKPSDDPVGAGRVLSSRATLSRLDLYEENIKTATGWLSTADSVLGSGEGSVQSLLTQIKEKAMQAATSTVTAENRLQIAQQVRGIMSQLVSLANTEFAGSNIFAGHKTTGSAYAETLGVSVHGENMDDYRYVDLVASPPDGGALPSRVVSFVPVKGGGGTAGTATYYYTADGGKTWSLADSTPTGEALPDSPPSPGCTISGGGVSVHVSDADVPVEPYYDPPGGANPLSDQSSLAQGTWFCVRPSAVYLGDDTDTQVSTTYMPDGATSVTSTANGYFARDVAVRLDPYLATDDTLPLNFIRYSYSVDDGNNWISATAPLTAPTMTLPVPGGSLTLDPAPTATPGTPPTLDNNVAGMQFVIHPHRADVDFQISEASRITVNMVGKDVFGGLYNYPGDLIKAWDTGTPYPDVVSGEDVYNDRPIPVGSENPYYNDGIPNMFESIGQLICALECNSQDGVQKSLESLNDVMNHILAKAAEIGGRENRLAATESAIIMRRYSEEDRLSQIEDVDLLELEVRLAQQQTAYNAVLKSTSMIMQLGLVNFL